MIGNSKVIKSLQSGLPLERHLNLQYRHDWRVTKFMGVSKTAKKLLVFGKDAHDWLKKIEDRTLILGGTTESAVPAITEQKTLTDIFQNELALEMAIIAPYEQAVQTAMKALDDTTRNLFEHLLKWHEEHVAWLEKQLRLIQVVGGEANYIQEKL